MRCHQVSTLKIPFLWSLQRLENKQHWRYCCLLLWLLGYANSLGSFSWEKKHLKWNRVCPTNRQTKRCPQAVSRDTGILSSFPLYTSFKICSCSGKTPTLWGAAWESSTILALLDWGLLCCRMARTALTQTTRWTVTFLTIAKDWKCGCDLRCGTLLSWLTCWRLPLTPLAEFTPGQSLWWRSSWTRRMRTLVCDSLDWGNLCWVFSYCVLRFSQALLYKILPSFLILFKLPLPWMLHFPSCTM